MVGRVAPQDRLSCCQDGTCFFWQAKCAVHGGQQVAYSLCTALQPAAQKHETQVSQINCL